MEQYRWLAALIAAHPNRQLAGRTRLQKTVKLLQMLGLPTRYAYSSHFYGPYSEGVQSDVKLLELLGLVSEEKHESGDSNFYYVLKASLAAQSEAFRPYQVYVNRLNSVDATILELAATYGAYREMGDDPSSAMSRLCRKKGTKCDEGRAEEAISLLKELGLERGNIDHKFQTA